MEYLRKITLDLYNDRGKRPAIFAKQGDSGRVLLVTLTADGVTYRPEDGVTAGIRVKKPDGHSVIDPATINADGTITAALTAQALACAGRCDADIYLDKAGVVLSDAVFDLLVQPAPIGDGLKSSNEFLEMVEERKRAQEAADAANEAAAKATGSSGAADEAEAKRAAAEAERVQAEQGRVEAETQRATAEAERVQAEADRDTAEKARAAAEAQRALAEADRDAAEQDRDTAEAQRVENEAARQTAEAGRDLAEQGRVTAEAARVEAEQQRVDEHTTAMQEAGEATQEALDAAKAASGAADLATHPPIIQNGTWWTWDTEAGEYIDTGESAWGNILYAAFWLDPFGGDLYMYTDDAYDGPGFELNKNGELEVVLNAGATP